MNRYSHEEPSAVGVFNDLESAERTIDELKHAGFAPDEIGIIGHVGDDQTVPTPVDTHAPEESTIAGFVRGGLGGCIIGALVALIIPGLGAVSGLGHWFEIVGGAILGAVAGGVFLAFESLLLTRPRTRFLAAQLQQGHFLVTVKNPNRKEEAVNVLRRQGLLTIREP